MDITARDINSIVRFLKMRGCNAVADPALYNGEVISGLRINDRKGDLNIAMGVGTVFDATNVPLRPLQNTDYVITMAFSLGLRWYVLCLPKQNCSSFERL
jgi:hypothetical protein